MSLYVVDTSALAKLYHQESGTERMKALLREPGSTSVISEYTLVEIYSALSRKTREGIFTPVDLTTLLHTFDGHVARGWRAL